MKRFTIVTLGCKVNQCESAALSGQLESRGLLMGPPSGDNDLVVLNTCTVTGRAAMQSRQAIRQAIRSNPGARIVVTGCYAQTAPDEIRRIEGVDCIVGHGDKLRIPELIQGLDNASCDPVVIHQNIRHARCFAPLPTVASETRTRAFLKIQDGCDTCCTYCIVPHARGRSRSMPAADVLDHIKRLNRNDFKEVVLTGIHLGNYGKDLDPGTTLTDLLGSICADPMAHRIRISSIEPTEVTSGIIALAADGQSPLCPHFHIPLQSGDDEILKRMGRPYTSDQFSSTIMSIHAHIPHAAIGMDLLVGFPGENDAAFDHTLDLVESLPVSYLHVFPFSPRKGTPAAGYQKKVPERIIKARCRRLRQLGEKKKEEFYMSNVGRQVDVLIERADSEETGGMSENYIPVTIPGNLQPVNSIVKVLIEKVAPNSKVVGRPTT